MSYFKKQKTQPTVRKENSEGYVILPILLGLLKNVLENEIIAASSSISIKLSSLIKEIRTDKYIYPRLFSLEQQATSNGEVKKFNKNIVKIITELSKKSVTEIITMLQAKDTQVPLSDNQYEAIVELSRTVYLFCPTNAWEEEYRSLIKDYDYYVEWKRIILIHSKELPTFQKIPNIGYIYTPKEIEISAMNKQTILPSIEMVNKILALDKPSINVV